ncbi:unnamed protein product [Prorocentrum cordatum]|nr:unnamed protein product [Polarella glacialis]
MAIFESSKPKHARTDPGPVLRQPGGGAAEAAGPAPAGHSSVCGQTCDAAPVPAPALAYSSAVPVRIGVLTCSDRAARGEYADESGPAIVSLVSAFGETSGALAPTFVHQLVVPDVEEEIHGALSAWSAARECDLILTTGGTGLGPRDVTPEATRRVVRRPADGIARAMAWQTSLVEPHSVLSRGVCGVTDTEVLVVNLPGHPSAVRQCLSVLLPVLPRALEMLGSPGAS